MLLKHLLLMGSIIFLSATLVGAQESTIDDSAAESEIDKKSTQSQEPLLTEEALEEVQKTEELAKEALEKEALEKAEQTRQEETSKTKPPKGVFKPTEEISEDLPVPFPVDI